MNRESIVAIIVIGFVLGGVILLKERRAAVAQEGSPARIQEVKYKAMPRRAIEALAPDLNPDDSDRLTHGLNAMSQDGWRLVAIDPFHSKQVGQGAIHYPSTFIFAR